MNQWLRMLSSALLAGFVTAVLYTVVQALTVTPLILKAETYEQADRGGARSALLVLAHGGATDGEDRDAWAPADGFERLAFSGLANLVTAVGFGFLLVAGYALLGRDVNGRQGLLWGLGGFVAFSLAPALGLPPELPGAAAADIVARQAWWIGTALASAAGLIALFRFSAPWPRVAGIALLAIPHLIGAPHPAGGEAGLASPELAAQFVVFSLATAALFWLVLGGTSGALYRRFGEPA